MDHLELVFHKATEKLEVSEAALKHWMRATKEHKSKVPIRDSGNYTSDQAKEITRLQHELRDTKNVLGALKKVISIMEN